MSSSGVTLLTAPDISVKIKIDVSIDRSQNKVLILVVFRRSEGFGVVLNQFIYSTMIGQHMYEV